MKGKDALYQNRIEQVDFGNNNRNTNYYAY